MDDFPRKEIYVGDLSLHMRHLLTGPHASITYGDFPASVWLYWRMEWAPHTCVIRFVKFPTIDVYATDLDSNITGPK